jgi:hypothetical protein
MMTSSAPLARSTTTPSIRTRIDMRLRAEVNWLVANTYGECGVRVKGGEGEEGGEGGEGGEWWRVLEGERESERGGTSIQSVYMKLPQPTCTTFFSPLASAIVTVLAVRSTSVNPTLAAAFTRA